MVGLPILFVLSSGPVAWMCQRRLLDYKTVKWYDRPFQSVMIRGPDWTSEALFNYRSIFLTRAEREKDRDIMALRRAQAEERDRIRVLE